MNDSRTKKSIVNILFNIANQLLSFLISFVTRTVFIRVFADKYLGLNAVFADVLSLLTVADLGIGTAMSYSFYRPLAEGDQRKLAALTGFYRKLYHWIALVIGASGLCVVPFLPLLVNTEIGTGELTVYYLFSLFKSVISYLYVSRTTILTADQKHYMINGIGIAASLLRMVFQMAAMLWYGSYAGYLLIDAVSVLLNNAAASRVAARKYPFLRQRENLAKEDAREIFRNIKAVFLHKLSALSMNATDNILISTIVSTSAAGLYSNYMLIHSKLSGMIGLLFTSLTASVGNLIVKEGSRRRYDVFRCTQAISFGICAVAVPCYVTLVNDFISIWLGESYLLSGSVVYAMGANLYLVCILYPLWSYREAVGLYSRIQWAMAACAVINVFLSILLGLWLGTAGILIASSVARLSTYVWYEPRLLFWEYFDENPRSYYEKIGRSAALTAGLTLCLDWFSRTFPAASWGAWFLKAVLIGSACLLAVGAVYGPSDDLSPLWSKLRRH